MDIGKAWLIASTRRGKASAVMKDPTRTEMWDTLQDQNLDVFDIEAAIYWFASGYHNGQSSDLYAALCQSPYKPCALTSCVEDAGNEPLRAYDILVGDFG